LLTGISNAQVQFKIFNYDAANFSVMFPANPESSSDITPSDYGNISSLMYSVDKDDVSYIVSVITYPKKLMDETPAKDLLDYVLESSVESIDGGKLVSFNEFNMGKHPALAFKITGNGASESLVLEGNYIMASNTLYQVFVVYDLNSKSEFAFKDNRLKFLNSFKILK
ncbi:MAG: hypothetical protein IAE91_00345, partial [Ignavibacteriaceae bacterium]|nr:hypothetical protein [Ignavibacteriaceae bacterium]